MTYPNGATKGDLPLIHAAIVKAESRHLKTDPKIKSFPILTSTGKLAKWYPRGNKITVMLYKIITHDLLWSIFRLCRISFLSYLSCRPAWSQIREQMSGPDLHVFTIKFLALKKLFFPHKKYFLKFCWLLFTFILCNFSVRTLKYFQKNFKLIFWP